MQCELVNPSDPYTFVAESREVAVLAVFLLNPAYGATPQSGSDDDKVPTFILGGAEEWYQEIFGRTVADGFKALEKDLADALASFMLGGFEDRRRYEAALAAITDPEKRTSFIDEWQDGHTSLNNIGGRAHELAEQIKAKLKGEAMYAVNLIHVKTYPRYSTTSLNSNRSLKRQLKLQKK